MFLNVEVDNEPFIMSCLHTPSADVVSPRVICGRKIIGRPDSHAHVPQVSEADPSQVYADSSKGESHPFLIVRMQLLSYHVTGWPP